MSTLGATILSAVVTAVVGVLVMECYQTTPWLAHKLMQWSVRIRYAGNPQRAKVRGEELSGLLEDLPTLFKFPTAGWFLLRALAYRFGRGLGRTPTGQLLKLRTRRHWAVLSGVLPQTIVIVIGVFLLSQLVSNVGADLWLVQSLFWSIAAVAVLRLAWNALEWWMEVFVVTDKQIIFTHGVITRKTDMMPLAELTDVSLWWRPVAGRLLGYGTLRVKSVRQKQDLELLQYLPRHEKVSRTLTDLISDEKPPRHHVPADGQDHENGI
ncbi:MAG: PH domain-containing protein [Pseudonocardiaceae bacterium]